MCCSLTAHLLTSYSPPAGLALILKEKMSGRSGRLRLFEHDTAPGSSEHLALEMTAAPLLPSVQFAAPTYAVVENAGSVTVQAPLPPPMHWVGATRR